MNFTQLEDHGSNILSSNWINSIECQTDQIINWQKISLSVILFVCISI